MIGETSKHNTIKILMAKRLYAWFGIAITEYPSSGQELDVFSINFNGVKLMVEIIWTDSRLNFFRDMLLLTRTNAHIKIVVAQSTVVQSSEFIREFEKTRISELEKGTIVPSRSDARSIRDVASRARQLYKNRLEEILASSEETSEQYKSDSKQILEFLTNNDERFQIYWNAWKKSIKEIKASNLYTHFIVYFINDLINASNENKESIQVGLYVLISSEDENISSRAKGLHDVIFS